MLNVLSPLVVFQLYVRVLLKCQLQDTVVDHFIFSGSLIQNTFQTQCVKIAGHFHLQAFEAGADRLASPRKKLSPGKMKRLDSK